MWLSWIFRTILIKKKRGYHHAQNRPKTNITKDYASRIVEKQEAIASLNTEIASIQKAIEEQKNTLKEKKTEAEAVLKKLLASGMSADEILEKLK